MAFNLLVVDDSAVMRSMITKTLKLSGIPLGQVFEAGNGEEGLSRFDEEWIDLALVDINMPIMDGETMIERLRERPDTADTPIVIVSTEGSETRIERLRKKGVYFVHKPFTPEKLREAVIAATGVSDESLCREVAVSGDDLDF